MLSTAPQAARRVTDGTPTTPKGEMAASTPIVLLLAVEAAAIRTAAAAAIVVAAGSTTFLQLLVLVMMCVCVGACVSIECNRGIYASKSVSPNSNALCSTKTLNE